MAEQTIRVELTGTVDVPSGEDVAQAFDQLGSRLTAIEQRLKTIEDILGKILRVVSTPKGS